ncbi:MAG: RNA polymerase sigma-70 factor [Bacteroidales bacterium]|nr:RNA polymerase sigma-70 factor [Bacteroidales bacterium]
MQGTNIRNNIDFNQIKKGDKLAFNSLFDEFYAELCEFSFRIIGRKELAEEVVADVFANIWIKRDTIEITINLKAYLYKSTKNMTISYIRKKKVDMLPLDDILPFQESLSGNPEQEILKKEHFAALENMLAIIPNKSRIVFKMHRLDNLKYREIAEVLDISQKTVEKHMGKALKILRNYKFDSVIGFLAVIIYSYSSLLWSINLT